MREKIIILKEDILSYHKLTRPISPDNAIGRLTRMEAISSKSINEEVLRKTKSTLSRLESALNMIDDPDFGLCKKCEEQIPIARLMIIPETYFCVECALKMDL
ncbi:MAG: TraR/DksA C4-type zinc finger protein [Deltaproteobacteria bacterium]|nr:TraR/DksA C4-type zinc finger protein [Deltaproteobacteria bacterium]